MKPKMKGGCDGVKNCKPCKMKGKGKKLDALIKKEMEKINLDKIKGRKKDLSGEGAKIEAVMSALKKGVEVGGKVIKFTSDFILKNKDTIAKYIKAGIDIAKVAGLLNKDSKVVEAGSAIANFLGKGGVGQIPPTLSFPSTGQLIAPYTYEPNSSTPVPINLTF